MPTPMSLASHPSPASNLPTAAPVFEFICLFTYDLKRKQKRWQDGRLKFHTFNKRIMVYDEKGNFIGDMHWREDFDFGEGEEIHLERGAVIVQVAECVGSKDQDLTELLDKRARDVDQRHVRSSSSLTSPLPPVGFSLTPMQQQALPPQGQFKQRSLADLVNTPRGPQGRATIPTTSPFEERIAAQESNSQNETQRSSKRRKREVSPPSKSGYAQNLFGATLTLSSWSAGATARSQPPTPTVASSSEINHPIVLPKDAGFIPSNPSAAWDPASNVQSSPGDALVTAAAHRYQGSAKNPSKPPRPKVLPTLGPSKGSKRDTQNDRTMLEAARLPQDFHKALFQSHHQHNNSANTNESVATRKTVRTGQDLLSGPSSCPTRNHGSHESSSRLSTNTPSYINKDVADTTGSSIEHNKIYNMQSRIKGLPRTNVELESSEAPKATLRIKARPKRGLLMVANKPMPGNLASPANTAEPTLSTRNRVIAVDGFSTGLPEATGISPNDCNSYHAASKRDATTNSDRDMSTDMALGNREAEGCAEPPLEQYGHCVRSGPIRSARIQSISNSSPLFEEPQKEQRGSEPETHRNIEVKTLLSGPRLASLGRRSIKSKEIIGSFDNEGIQGCRETMVSPPNDQSVPTMLSSTILEISTPLPDKVDIARQEASRPAEAARLINPATRGRKAAKKSDAAGTFLQSVIPAGMGVAPVVGVDRQDTNLLRKSNIGGTGTSSKPISKLPGFSTANGGPWSKEAFDLLGCTRPG
ncbi:uncharacterized protein CTRU02_207592 [Colletotrichum truncatum]|uniref:Uncharacterized protein n=1 Tax=Colletotrichum truncatum TaxID=5467 RepID=A0ACC3Z1A5_COLTU|nr:uncharacterized protein CTRU02_09307 [Colletotrichum truncatum]KAF6788986.1 hypothetical protein CTRU02_09307 [Colletotrichum truncatum]